MKFPDTKRAVREILKPFGTTYLQLTADYAEPEKLPAILVYKVGGSENGPFRTDRIVVEVYAAGGTSSVDDVATKVHDFLVSGPHDGKDYGLLDRVTVETTPIEVPQPENWPAMVQATYRVSVRGTR